VPKYSRLLQKKLVEVVGVAWLISNPPLNTVSTSRLRHEPPRLPERQVEFGDNPDGPVDEDAHCNKGTNGVTRAILSDMPVTARASGMVTTHTVSRIHDLCSATY
jgi:hypothetical protein